MVAQWQWYAPEDGQWHDYTPQWNADISEAVSRGMPRFKLGGKYGFTIDGDKGTQKNLEKGTVREMRRVGRAPPPQPPQPPPAAGSPPPLFPGNAPASSPTPPPLFGS
eukprot:EG_transcript_55363